PAPAASQPISPQTASACVLTDYQAYTSCLMLAAGSLSGTPKCENAQAYFYCTQAYTNCLNGGQTVTCGSDIQKCLDALASCTPFPAEQVINAGCLQSACTPGPGGSACCASSPVQNVNSRDPNSLFGPIGVGGQQWISGAGALTYGISFANDLAATAPAQQVVVTQPLGMGVNLATLNLPEITIQHG